jgi:hypothetical protein
MIVQREGWEGVWARKRGYIQKMHPESTPVLDEAEKRFRQDKPSSTTGNTTSH